jgi:hypothetical protein
MSNNFQNRIYGNGSTLTLGAGQSILGSGQIGVGSSMALVNNGTVSATQSTALVINTTAGVTNNSVLRADGGTLVLQEHGVQPGCQLEGWTPSTAVLCSCQVPRSPAAVSPRRVAEQLPLRPALRATCRA